MRTASQSTFGKFSFRLHYKVQTKFKEADVNIQIFCCFVCALASVMLYKILVTDAPLTLARRSSQILSTTSSLEAPPAAAAPAGRVSRISWTPACTCTSDLNLVHH